MSFRLSNVEHNITMGVSTNFTLKTMKYFTKKKKEHHFENKGICGIILHCTTPSVSTKTISTYNVNKKAKTGGYQQKTTYHRWFLCADCMNPPHTFVIITHTNQQTCDLLHHVHDNSFMGMPFYLVEPGLVTARVGEYLHIIENKGERLYPLRINARILKKEAPIELPAGSEHTYYFLLESEPLKLTSMKYSMASCTGYQCDRHWGKDGCVCAHGSMGNPLVYQFSFQLNVNAEQFNTDTQVCSLSSFRTMSVFFHDLVEYTHATTGPKEEKVLHRRRSQIRRITSYINAHGGWKIIGWCKRGMLSVDGETDKVENREVNLNLSFVYPQNQHIFKDPTFRALRIREDFDMFDHQLPNLSQEVVSSSSDDDSDSEGSNQSDSDETPVTPEHINYDKNKQTGNDESTEEESFDDDSNKDEGDSISSPIAGIPMSGNL